MNVIEEDTKNHSRTSDKGKTIKDFRREMKIAKRIFHMHPFIQNSNMECFEHQGKGILNIITNPNNRDDQVLEIYCLEIKESNAGNERNILGKKTKSTFKVINWLDLFRKLIFFLLEQFTRDNDDATCFVLNSGLKLEGSLWVFELKEINEMKPIYFDWVIRNMFRMLVV